MATGRRAILFVYSRPVEGKDAEYEEWYSNEHLRDVLGLDGFEAAQRWVFDRPQLIGASEPEWRHVALYEVPIEDYERARAALVASGVEREEALAAGRTPRVPISPALSEDRLAYWFVENSPRLTR